MQQHAPPRTAVRLEEQVFHEIHRNALSHDATLPFPSLVDDALLRVLCEYLESITLQRPGAVQVRARNLRSNAEAESTALFMFRNMVALLSERQREMLAFCLAEANAIALPTEERRSSRRGFAKQLRPTLDSHLAAAALRRRARELRQLGKQRRSLLLSRLTLRRKARAEQARLRRARALTAFKAGAVSIAASAALTAALGFVIFLIRLSAPDKPPAPPVPEGVTRAPAPLEASSSASTPRGP